MAQLKDFVRTEEVCIAHVGSDRALSGSYKPNNRENSSGSVAPRLSNVTEFSEDEVDTEGTTARLKPGVKAREGLEFPAALVAFYPK
jgi:hypothetical protein